DLGDLDAHGLQPARQVAAALLDTRDTAEAAPVLLIPAERAGRVLQLRELDARRVVHDVDDALCLRVRQWPEQDTVAHGEDCDIRADTEGECQRSNDGEAR